MQLVHQTQNGSLIGVVDALGFLLLQAGVYLVAFGFLLTCAAVQQLHARNTDTTQHRSQKSQSQHRQLQHAGAAQSLQIRLQFLQLLAQWLAVIVDAGLRFTRRHQTLQVAQNSAGLSAGVVVLLDQRLQLLTHLRVARCAQTQFAAAVEQSFRDFLEGVQVLA